MMRGKHQDDIARLKKDYDDSLADIRSFHEKDKSLLESMLKKCEDRLRRGDTDQSSTMLEIENRYLREIKVLSDTFEAYKKQVEKHMS